MNPEITFTDAAASYIQKMVEKDHALGLRLTLKKTGCSGYSYSPTLVTAVNSGDVVLKLDNGVVIYIDPVWLHVLQGIKVDYIEEDKSGLKQKRLTFINPNESARCGCGESFHIE